MSKTEISSSSLQAIIRQIRKQHDAAQQRAEELGRLIDVADTNLSLVAMETHGALRDWQQGLVGQGMTLEELNEHFAIKHDAMGDGRELWEDCQAWVQTTRKHVQLLLGFLGAKANEQQLLIAITELRERYLDGDPGTGMDIIECLHMLRDMVQWTTDLEAQMQVLRRVCQQRVRDIKVPDLVIHGVA